MGNGESGTKKKMAHSEFVFPLLFLFINDNRECLFFYFNKTTCLQLKY